ncbi:MAG TPA: DUF6152 family protein [Vicinamibacterales bacterium]|jgi:hypothetical protein
MKSNWVALACAVACVLVALPVSAHHSGAMFDREKVIELKGTVKELQWSNPHIWIQVVVQENGAPKELSLEGGSPNTLSRSGWRSTTFKPGDEVTVRFNPMKDGTPAGAFVGAKFSDGKTIGRWD